jgi:hypothetical protein
MKIYTSAQSNIYQTSIKSLESIDETLAEEITIETELSEIFYLKTEVDQVLKRYGFESLANEKGVVLVDAKSMGPLLIDELVKRLSELSGLNKKRLFSEESRDKLARSGMALPDGSYPIENESDLENAIYAFGRAKNKARAKKHIIKRAVSLGRQDMIPEKWKNRSK